MKSRDLQRLYNLIQKSPKKGLFFITKRKSNLFITKTILGRPALGFTFDQPQPVVGDSVFEDIGITFFSKGEVVFNGKNKECSFVIIENIEERNSDRFYDLLQELSDEIKYDKRRFIDISEIISYLVSWAALFRKQTLSKNKDTLGLFGELYFILESGHPEIILQRWRAPQNAKYDFAYGKNLLDVKTSSIGKEHHFELEQISPLKDYKKYIASICVKECDQKGQSIQQLLEKLACQVSKAELAKFLKKRTRNMHLGRNKYRVTSISIYNSLDIPQPIKTSEYTFDIKFGSNLSLVQKTMPFKSTINKFL